MTRSTMDVVLHRARYTLRERAGNLRGAATARAVWRVRARPLGDHQLDQILTTRVVELPVDTSIRKKELATIAEFIKASPKL